VLGAGGRVQEGENEPTTDGYRLHRLGFCRIEETEAPVTRAIRVAVPIEKTDPGNIAD
jgi:hypothetical protein